MKTYEILKYENNFLNAVNQKSIHSLHCTHVHVHVIENA